MYSKEKKSIIRYHGGVKYVSMQQQAWGGGSPEQCIQQYLFLLGE